MLPRFFEELAKIYLDDSNLNVEPHEAPICCDKPMAEMGTIPDAEAAVSAGLIKINGSDPWYDCQMDTTFLPSSPADGMRFRDEIYVKVKYKCGMCQKEEEVPAMLSVMWRKRDEQQVQD
jgi:hypothetical protein